MLQAVCYSAAGLHHENGLALVPTYPGGPDTLDMASGQRRR
jgi:hypothetical protein